MKRSLIKINQIALTSILISTGLILSGCKTRLPAEISFTKTDLFPEGISWWEKGKVFVTGSLAEGTIHSVTADGKISPLITDDDLMSTIGVRVNNRNNFLYVCNSHPGAANPRTSGVHKDASPGSVADLAVYDLETRQRLYFINLAALSPRGTTHFCNDITFNDSGYTFITDSFSPLIYQVDPHGGSQILFKADEITGKPGDFQFNGVVWHPDNYLILARHFTGELYKLELETMSLSKIDLKGGSIGDPDGLVLLENNRLAVVSNNFSGNGNDAVHLLNGSENWASATVIDTITGFDTPTTATIAAGSLYVLNAHLKNRFQGKSISTYELFRAEFNK